MFSKAKMLLAACLLLVATVAMSAVAFAADGVDWDSSTVTATGLGMAPANAVNATQARMLARQAARVEAYRQLAELINGVQVDSQTTVQNMLIVNDTVTTRVNAVIKGARIVDERALEDGGYEVTLEVSLYGTANSLASAVLPRQTTREAFPSLAANVVPTAAAALSLAPQPAPAAAAPAVQPAAPVAAPVVTAPAVQAPQVTAPAPAVKAPAAPQVTAPTVTAPAAAPAVTAPAAEAAPAAVAAGGYTGLIVDCSGLGLRPAMSPVIKNELGTPIYGYKNLDSGTVISKGMAGYTTDISNAARAGSNPLVVRAVGLDGSNPVISAADANRVLLENEATKFLDQTNVVFVR